MNPPKGLNLMGPHCAKDKSVGDARGNPTISFFENGWLKIWVARRISIIRQIKEKVGLGGVDWPMSTPLYFLCTPLF